MTSTIKRWRLVLGAVVAAAVVTVAAVLAKGSPVLPETRAAVPTAKVVRGPLKLTVFATGELRAGFVPGAYAVPSGIFGLARAQNSGCALVRM